MVHGHPWADADRMPGVTQILNKELSAHLVKSTTNVKCSSICPLSRIGVTRTDAFEYLCMLQGNFLEVDWIAVQILAVFGDSAVQQSKQVLHDVDMDCISCGICDFHAESYIRFLSKSPLFDFGRPPGSAPDP